jgi:alpha-galactosidase
MSAQFISLHGKQSSIVLEYSDSEAPLWRYWGGRLPDCSTPPCSVRQTREMPPASLEFDQPLSIAPTFGTGWFGHAALLSHQSGRYFAQQWNRCKLDIESDSKISFTLHDSVARLKLIVSIALDIESDVVSIQSGLTNEGDGCADISWIAAATLPLPADACNVVSYTGQWVNEFQSQTDVLTRTQWRRENVRGRTSHDCFPGAIVQCAGATAFAGNVYGAHLAWSGNHVNMIEWMHDGRYQWQLGEWLAPGEVRLEPGECIESPIVYAAYSSQGMNGLAHSFHQQARQLSPVSKAVLKPRPVHLNTWEAVYFDHNEDALMALATAAAEVGVERFVLDDGWFHGRNNDRAGLGDWFADVQKFPLGLLPLATQVIAKGMTFGLWIEPEMVNADSELYRAYPGWVLSLDSRPLITGRNQLVLNLCHEGVVDYLFAKLDELLSTLPISYLKWDMNRDLAMAGSKGRAAYRQQTLALYRLLARLNTAHPNVEIESCASGGGRIDFGILAHTHRFWASDCNDALARLSIQHGALQWLPPEMLGAHIGDTKSHTTGRSQSLPFRAAVMLPMHLGVEADVRKLDSHEREILKSWITLFKQLRGQLHGTQVWRGEAGDGIVWQAHGDANSIIVFVYRVKPTTQRWSPLVRLPMLSAQMQYNIARIDPDVNNATQSAISGAWLQLHGLSLPRMQAESALIYQLTATSINVTTAT